MKKLILTFGTMLLMIASGCTSGNEPGEIIPNDRVDIVLDGATRSAAENLKSFYVDFTTDAIGHVDSDSDISGKNVVVSPLSASMVLAMVANGVEGDISKEIANYLGVADVEAVNSLANILLKELPKADNQTDLSLANSIWVNRPYELTSEFASRMMSEYLADLRNEDFSGDNARAVKNINKWCSDNTGGMITNMIEKLSPSSLALLLNTLYFKGIWKDKAFLVENTEKMSFHGAGGTKDVDMMFSYHTDRKYASDDSFDAFYLDFGNSAFSFMVVLPKETLSLTDANRLLTAAEFTKLEEEAVKCRLAVYLPRFKVETGLDVSDVLASVKLPDIKDNLSFDMFEPACEGVVLFRQSARLEIDENGAKAASVSTGEIKITSPEIVPGETYTVKVDRPFYFFLKEKSTGACLLSGRIADL
ncbi:MAG: hypothetical protein K2G52_10805 [Muribaculaceae bacterium]|nr:hypothetical protein [Muribaculaceae bacterium]